MNELFLSAFVLGILFNAAPGAILAESLRRGLKGGFAPAFAVQIGSLVGDGLWVVLGLLGAAVLISIPYVQIPLASLGALLLGYLAYQSLKDSLAPLPVEKTVSCAKENRSALLTGVALSISNPLNIVYWAALGGTITALSGETPDWIDFSIFVSGFMLSSILWCFFASGIISVTRRYMSLTLWRVLHIGSGVGLFVLMIMVINGLIKNLL